MFNLSTLTALAVVPAVTLSVIAILTVLLVLSILDGRRRLNAFAVKSAKMSARLTASLVAAVIESAQKEMKRREAKTIGWTYDQLKRIGFDKLALGTVTPEDVIFGDRSADPFEELFGLSPTGRRTRRHYGDGFTMDVFSMDDLKSALRPGEGPNGEKYPHSFDGGTTLHFEDDNAGGFDTATHVNPKNPTRREAGPRPYQETDVEDAAGLEAGPRPYHTARSPRAG